MPANERVVITGMGVVSSIGIGKDEFWKNLIAGKSGISEVERFDTSTFPIHRAGEAKGFRTDDFMPKEISKSIGRCSQLAIAAAKLALEDGMININKDKTGGLGIIIGTTMGEVPSIEMIDRFWIRDGEDGVYSSNVKNFPVNNISDNVALFFGLTGHNYVISTACAAGNYSIGYAFDIIRTGRRGIMLAGGADPLSRLAFTGFNRLFAMAPEKCQPFDKNRKGMMLGEGGAILVIESLERAKNRGANIYAEILGYALSCDAHNMTIPSQKGVTKVIEKALKNSGIKKKDVGYISAHGTGTGLNDKTESASIKEVFGSLARDIPVSSIKSMLGHTMGTASALEAIACCLAMRDSMIPPTINFETPDSECDIDCVPNKARKKDVRVALNNSFAFGGNNACLAIGRYEG
ncbi:MAG: beta-ketoacyl-[acyl-carrier-protein] synthase family protein [Candidatus Omnitrophota bacterium]|nr:beta-ketoacyl-[acyl-carrier-protein] synthase family protein [Candidatus Omnitrophota bacterium]